MELDKKRFVFAPVNDNTKLQYTTSGSHWTLNVVDIQNKLIYYLDSNNGNVSNAHIFYDGFEKLFGEKFKFIYGLNHQYQKNSYDCGVFLLRFIEILVKYLVNNDMKLNVKNDNKTKCLDFIFKGEKQVDQNYMGDFRKNNINLI